MLRQLLQLNNRLRSKLPAARKARGAIERRTGIYTSVAEFTKKFDAFKRKMAMHHLLLIFSLLACSFVSMAALEKNTSTFTAYLAQEKTHLTAAVVAARQQKSIKNEQEFTAKMQQLSLMLKMTLVKTRSLQGFLEQQQKEQSRLNQRLKQLQQSPLTHGAKISGPIVKVEYLLRVNKQTLDLINDDLALSRELEFILRHQINSLEFWHTHFVLEQKLKRIKFLKAQLNQNLDKLYKNNMVNQYNKSTQAKDRNLIEFEAKMLINNQNIAAIHYYISALTIEKTVVKTDIFYLKNPNTKNLQRVIDVYREALNDYLKIEHLIQQIAIVLDNEVKLVAIPSLKKSVNSLQNRLKKQSKEIELQKQGVLKNLTDYQNQLKQLMSSRQTLAEYGMSSWPIILKKMLAIPGLFFKYLKSLSLKIYDAYLWLSPWSLLLLWGGLVLIIGFFLLINRFLKMLSSDKERSRLAGYLYDGILTVVQRNIPYFCFTSMLWLVLYCTHISFVNYQLLFKLISVWLIFKILILIARLILLERISDSSGKDVKLYYRLKWLLLFGGWTTALMTISHLLPLSIMLQDIFNRLFMLFILTVSLVTWKSKDVIPYLLLPLLKSQKRYVKNAISLLVILVPITLFTTAVIGLFGFINLAWTMSQYQAYILLVLVGYILARGLIFDALEFFSEWMISALRNGWLWVEVFLKPLDKILRILLLLFCVVVLFQLFGWHSDSLVMINLEKIIKYTIINTTGIHITIASTIEFFILLALFVWASKWTREFCYRWLYKHAKDAGIRNSLSVFTQYAVILIGSVLTLHVLGFNFSGMSMIIGGLAVGMGFGLRDFASNIVGGIMLLIERPVREGDLITLGEYEGRVAHIGIRSMRVSSWDNMEVLIPNAETFNKPFTNWTHQDSIVRTVIPIKVNRADDPLTVQQLILNVLTSTPEIVSDPPAQVFLKKIDEALIEFEARYFINVQIHTRFEVQSKVLFAITAQFKAANIRAPIESIFVELKEGYSELSQKNTSSEN